MKVHAPPMGPCPPPMGNPGSATGVFEKKFDWFVGKPLVLMETYKKRFDWPPGKFVNLNNDTDITRGHVFVTGASSDHYR